MKSPPLSLSSPHNGKRFIEAWKRARIIVNTGGGHSGASPTPPGK